MNTNDIKLLLSDPDDKTLEEIYQRLKNNVTIIESSYNDENLPLVFDEILEKHKVTAMVTHRVFACILRIESEIEASEPESIPKVFKWMDRIIQYMTETENSEGFSFMDSVAQDAIKKLKLKSEKNVDKTEATRILNNFYWEYNLRGRAYDRCCEMLEELKKPILADTDVRTRAHIISFLREISESAYAFESKISAMNNNN